MDDGASVVVLAEPSDNITVVLLALLMIHLTVSETMTKTFAFSRATIPYEAPTELSFFRAKISQRVVSILCVKISVRFPQIVSSDTWSALPFKLSLCEA